MYLRLITFVKELIRVFKITKKPNKQEFSIVVKVSAIGIAVIGLIGFLIYIGWEIS